MTTQLVVGSSVDVLVKSSVTAVRGRARQPAVAELCVPHDRSVNIAVAVLEGQECS